MNPFELWEKMINAKVYAKEVVTNRVNVVYAVRQLNDEEYTILINLIDEKYTDVA